MLLINGKNIKNVVVPKRIENVNTRFGINGPVFVLYDNKIKKGIVRRIDCRFPKGISKLGTTILHTPELPEAKEMVQFLEKLCFGSKEDLKASL